MDTLGGALSARLASVVDASIGLVDAEERLCDAQRIRAAVDKGPHTKQEGGV